MTLLAIINPLEVLPIFPKLLQGKDDETHRRVARNACLYAAALAFFFLVFGKLIMWAIGVPLSMMRIVGGIILMRIGFELFAPATGSGITMVKQNQTQILCLISLCLPIAATMGTGLVFDGVIEAAQTYGIIPLK